MGKKSISTRSSASFTEASEPIAVYAYAHQTVKIMYDSVGFRGLKGIMCGGRLLLERQNLLFPR